MQIFLTTTGAVPTIVIPEFGNRVLVHPIIAYNITSEFDADEVRTSISIQTAINNGWLTATDDSGHPITELSNLQIGVEELFAENVFYTPLTLTNWTSSPTPDLVNLALDELASRIFTIETGGGGGGISLTDLSATSPLVYDNLTGVFSINQSNGSTNGYLSSTDWTTFNNKQDALSGTGIVLSTAGTISYLTDNSTNWNTAFSERLQWDGGSTNLIAATGRTSLGATTVGSNLFTATNPSAITFIRVNADNSVSLLDAATYRTAIGAGTGNGTVTSIVAGTNLTGGTITTSGTISLATTLTGLTSVTSTTFVGALTGNASTSTALQTARTINGISFNGSANITVTAAAGTLTGTTLNATVVNSSLTSVGTIATGVWSATTISANRGGTGQTTYSIGDLLYADTTSTLAKLSDIAIGNALISGGIGVAPSYGKIGLDTHVSGTLPIANGGTNATTANIALNNLLPSQTGNNSNVLSTDGTNTSWVSVSVAGVNGGTVTSVSGSGGTTGLTLTTGGAPITVSGTLTLGGTLSITNGGTGQTTALAAFNALSPLSTKGDLLADDGTNNVRVPVGTTGQVLLADSTTATGLRWGSSSDIAGQTIRFLGTNTDNSNTVANTTTETNFTSNGTNYVIPANTIKAGSLVRFVVYGRFGTKGGQVGTLTIRLKIGTLVINSTGTTITPGSAQTNVGFQFTGQVQCRTAGATGTVYSHLLCVFNGAGSSAATTFAVSSNGTNTFNTTIANTLQMSAQWATANADNTITLEQLTVEILN